MKDSRYIILPGKFATTPDNKEIISLYNQAFKVWFEVWEYTYTKNKVNVKVDPDTFFRQDYIPVIVLNNEVVAVHLYSFFNLKVESVLQQSYLNHTFTSEYFALLEQKHVTTVMTMESLTINPKFRRSKFGGHFAASLISLGQKLFLDTPKCDGIVAAARKDVSAADTAYSLGFYPLLEDLNLYNTPVDLVLFHKSDKQKYLHDLMKQEIDNLWNKREDYSRYSSTDCLKKVA